MNRNLALPELILIDLDGTLVDSAPDLHASINAMQQQLGGPARSEVQVRGWIGNGIERLVHRALTGSLDGKANAERFAQAITLFDQAYSRHNGVHSRLFPGVIEGLDALAALDCHLVCVTNKPRCFTQPLLRTFNLDGYFELVLSGDSLAYKKPHPKPLLHAAKRFRVSPAASLLIGDSATDIKAARAAEFAVVCVSYGYNHGQNMRTMKGSLKPDAVIDSLPELLACWRHQPTIAKHLVNLGGLHP